MSTALRLTVDEFDRMIEEDVFADRPKVRIELIEGELREMTPPGPTHEEVIDELTEWSFETVPLDQVRVRVQNTIGIPDLDSVPLPDLAWVRRRSYRKVRPTAGDVFLLVESSDSSLDYDCGPKSALYAQAGIADYWVVNIPYWMVEVFRDPGPSGYRSRTTFDTTQTVSPLAFPHIELAVARLFFDSPAD